MLPYFKIKKGKKEMPILNPNYADINFEEIAGTIGLKAKHMPMLIGSFLEESDAILETLGSSIDAKDYENIKAAAHSIKGSAGNLKFAEVYEMAKEMELAATESSADFNYGAYLEAIKAALETIPK